MSEEKRAVTVTFRLTQEEKNNLEYCASKLRMTQTEAVVKGLEIIRGIIDKQREGKGGEGMLTEEQITELGYLKKDMPAAYIRQFSEDWEAAVRKLWDSRVNLRVIHLVPMQKEIRSSRLRI